MSDAPGYQQFGLIVAYLAPGFITLVGLAPVVPMVHEWLAPFSQGDMGFGPPVYALLGATTLGMIVSCVRWLLIDHLHHATGLKPPAWKLQRLEVRLEAFNYIVEGTYRYYQFYANALVAVVWAYVVNRIFGTSPLLGLGTDVGVLILCAVLFAGSRDALAKYYQRSAQLIG